MFTVGRRQTRYVYPSLLFLFLLFLLFLRMSAAAADSVISPAVCPLRAAPACGECGGDRPDHGRESGVG